MNLLDYIPTVLDFPKPGIAFRDISPLLANPAAFSHAVKGFQNLYPATGFDFVLGIESRGFIFGTALAQATGKGLVLVRKPNKLPDLVHSEQYGLEYGNDALEIQQTILPKGSRVLLVDDVLATGGTLNAAAKLVKKSGAVPVSALVLLEIAALGGAANLKTAGLPTQSLLQV
jgi:adenine phosphoribosyltransferase